MILEILFGALVASTVFVVYKQADVGRSANHWILSIAKFAYYSGHPLLDDDQRFERITKAYMPLVIAFFMFVLKTLLIVLCGFTAIAFLSLVLELYREPHQQLQFSPALVKKLLLPDHLLHWPFLVGTLLPLAIFPWLPRKAVHDEEYTALGKFLHYLLLGNTGIVKLQFGLECLLNRSAIRLNPPSQNVYVAGLARSGSTSLMQHLGQLPQFVSLSYRNMPFVFMPRTGPKLISQKETVETERSHKDGVMHSLSTYEALEEPFWLHFAGLDFVRDNHLIGHSIADGVHAKYQKFRSLIAGGKIYLAKNNNHLLRAQSLHRLDNKNGLHTRTIIPFRDPYTQAKSLLQQHNILSALQKKDDFALDYMDFLGHHEFGLHLKTSVLGDSAADLQSTTDPNSLEHWLEVWKLFYQRAFDLYAMDSNCCFFCYEDYLKNPRGSLVSLCSFLDIAPQTLDSIDVNPWSKAHPEPTQPQDPELVSLYSNMMKKAVNHEI